MQRAQVFEELSLRLRPDGKGAYITEVVQSPYGCRNVSFNLRDLGFPLEAIPESLTMAVQGGTSTGRDLRSKPSTASGLKSSLTPQQIGGALFQALFHDDLLRTFLLCLGRMESRPDHGLRIRLAFDPTEPELRKLIALPWELLYRSETRDFLSRNPLTPVVRYLEVPRLTAPADPGDRLRILVALASPRDLATLNLERECLQMKEALSRNPRIEARFLDHPTPAMLRSALQDSEFHVFHYMGHGGRDAATGEGFLLFEDSRGYSQPVPGAVLGEALKGGPRLRFVFLNACRTAQIQRDGGDPFAMMASSLVLAGVPAITAMQFPISDAAALLFSQRLYEALASGFSVDAAVAEARLAIHLASPASMEWIIPALYMSIPDGRILLASTMNQESSDRMDTSSKDHQKASNVGTLVTDQGTVGGPDSVVLGGSGYVVQGGIHFGRSSRNESK
ncbi:MAG TPA: CHAT domain-containing protein [Thermoanaerobaculia bacterium]